ncbi:MAG: diguanylate cyclase, partial [Chloroflexota bacterium]
IAASFAWALGGLDNRFTALFVLSTADIALRFSLARGVVAAALYTPCLITLYIIAPTPGGELWASVWQDAARVWFVALTMGVAADARQRTGAALARLAEQQGQEQAILEGSNDGISVCIGTKRVYANQALAEFFGYQTPDEACGRDFDTLIVDEDRARMREMLLACQDGAPGPLRTTFRIERADGTTRAAEISTRAVTYNSSPAALSILRDVTERQQLQEELSYLAHHDPLTGLLNRRLFTLELERVLAAALRYRTPGAVLFIDLDHFKAINDTLGHEVGDQVLCGVAKLMHQTLRASDIAGRLGGDEFAVILPNASPQDAVRAADRLVAVLKEPIIFVEGQPVHCSASIGIAAFPSEGATVTTLLAQADRAMYEAKHLGKGQAQLHRDVDAPRVGDEI